MLHGLVSFVVCLGSTDLALKEDSHCLFSILGNSFLKDVDDNGEYGCSKCNGSRDWWPCKWQFNNRRSIGIAFGSSCSMKVGMLT